MLRRRLLGSISLPFLVACGGGGGGSPTNPPPPSPPVPGTASFTVSSAAGSQRITYSDQGGNLIFCRPGGARFFIRLARDRGGDGAGGPHIDIDICGTVTSGSYPPTDPRVPCPTGQAWDVFWHDEGGATFVNDSQSSSCRLDLIRTGTVLDGMFTCDALKELNGTRTLNIHTGSFHCSEGS